MAVTPIKNIIINPIANFTFSFMFREIVIVALYPSVVINIMYEIVMAKHTEIMNNTFDDEA
ncbi:hypothetical protein IP76_20520 [Rhizobium sp. AAP43]|nr:hypothetical protein IP76_20520 [Rhizobium sp. AAP43]